MARHDDVPAFPFPPGPLSSSPPEYVERRASCPFGKVRLRSGHESVLLVTHADAMAALGDVRMAHDLTAPGSPRLTTGLSFRDEPNIILNMDGERHRRIRRIIASAFTPRNTERWKPMIHRIADELIDEIETAAGPVDIVEAFCWPLPIRVIGGVLGVPQLDIGCLRGWSDAFALSVPMTLEFRERRLGEFARYVAELIANRRASPGNDLVDDLIAARDGTDRLDEPELASLVMALIVAGTQTTANVLGRSLLTLLRDDRALWSQLVAAPDLAPAVVEEMLRYNPLGDLMMLRVATEDVALPSGTVRKGEAVVVSVNSALNDETVYGNPQSVRFDRDNYSQLIFGTGVHFCVGMQLAKLELQLGLGQLARRLPGIRLAAELDDLRFTEGDELSSLVSLPVTW